MMKVLISLLLTCPWILSAQEGRGDLRFVFYNVENLFDPFDDSLKLDDEFLPGAGRHWTWDRFLEKERKIYKVLACAGGWKPAELIGLCEVENRFVLNWLLRKTPLLKYNYRIIHRDSPDERGIDVALLYLSAIFRPLECSSVPVGYFRGRAGYENLPRGLYRPAAESGRAWELQDPTRDILYVKGVVLERDTIHIIICHWPSRWEGYLESLPDRLEAAHTVRWLLDSIWSCDFYARILVAGDLNDELSDPSLSTVLRVRSAETRVEDTCLYNTGTAKKGLKGAAQLNGLKAGDESSGPPGTLKYRGNWYEFDHIFVSGGFLSDTNLFVKPGGKRILAPDFLLENDPSSPGNKPFRTFNGYKYRGGFSDHLPVYLDIWRSE